VSPFAERVLVLDAHLRHAVAIVGSLRRQGVSVVSASAHRRFPAKYSRYRQESVLLGSDTSGAELLRIIEDHHIDVVIAAGLPGNELLCLHRQQLEPHVRAPFNDLETYRCLSNKDATGLLAESLGVQRPVTRQACDPEDAAQLAEELRFPLVFKSPIDQGTVRYANDVEELRRLIASFIRDNPALIDRGAYPLVQEYIDGIGHGFYGLADHGQLRAYFMHRRLHEVPPTGGPSAMAMSYRDPKLLELGTRFFSEASWHGVAMVEFKRRRLDGEYYLIEINPKFWGSLDLSISAGVDFPFLLYKLLIGAPLDVIPGAYRDDAIFRWLTMDLAYAVSAHRLRGYVRSFADDRIAHDFDRNDMLPTAMLFASGISRMAAPMRNQTSWRTLGQRHNKAIVQPVTNPQRVAT
jgi:predicted ATP-grasp superfamily ATP-dependent carboligase